MALTLSLDGSFADAGVKFQHWTITGDGTVARFNTGLKRVISCSAQNQDDTTANKGCYPSGVSVRFTGAPTSAKKWRILVIGE